MTNRSLPHQRGDLVHIPQSVVLIDPAPETNTGPQLTIPLRFLETESPCLGVVIEAPTSEGGYARIYCEGDTWTVKNENIYSLEGRTK